MIEPARGPNEEPNTEQPEGGDSGLLARALRVTPLYRLIRLEWELGNLLRESIDSGWLGTDLSDQSSELGALKKSLSAYLMDGHKSMKELNRRLERIPELIEESRLHTQSPFTPSDAAKSNAPLPPHLQTLIAREAAVCIMESLVTDGLHSCEQTSKEDAIFGFYEGILKDLESLSPSLTDEEFDKQLSRIIDQTKEEQLSLKELIDSTITSQEERVADFIGGSLEQLQTTQHLLPDDLVSIAPYLYSDFQDRLAPHYRKLSESLHSSIDDAVTQLNDVHKKPLLLPDCIRWFQLSIDALSDEQSDLSSDMEDFCVTLVQQTEDTAETAHLLLSHHPAHDEVAAYVSVSEGKDASHLVRAIAPNPI